MEQRKLTERQLEMALHLANGKSNGEIAKEMSLSLSSVNKTINRARQALHATTAAHMVAIVIAQGWLVWNPDDSEVIYVADHQ